MLAKRKLCPSCWKYVSAVKKDRSIGKARYCSSANCKREIPLDYLENYGRFPPAVFTAVGFSEHGKSVYFSLLFYVLREMGLYEKWPGFCTLCLNDDSIKTVYDNIERLKKFLRPHSTPKVFPEPTILKVESFPGQRNCTLLMYDVAGESFRKSTTIEQYAGFLERAKTVLFFFSLEDAEKNGGITSELYRLAETYHNAMTRLRVKPRTQDLVLVYTKADTLEKYLGKSFRDVASRLIRAEIGQEGTNSYKEEVGKISWELRQFTKERIDARGFLRLAEKIFSRISMCAVSSLGAAPPEDGEELEFLQPRRVLDPLLYVMQNGVDTKSMGARGKLARVFDGNLL